jgi:uncharacterized protein (DUF2336 family)
MQQLSLIEDLESSIEAGNAESRVKTLRRITDLFLHDAGRLSEAQIHVFDDVLCLLAAKIEESALVELSSSLAPVDMAPVRLVKRLAQDEAIAVAAPVLSGSKRLSTADLIEIAQTRSQAHLLAISERTTLDSKLTDVLVVRGNRKVVSTLARNAGADFSEHGFGTLVEKAQGDDALGEIVGLRKDLPTHLLRELLRRATETVKKKIRALVAPERRAEIERVIAGIGSSIEKNTKHDYGEAECNVAALAAAGELDEKALVRFVYNRQQEELIVGLARMSSTPIHVVAQLMSGHRNDAILFPCKAADLSWHTVELILHHKLAGQPAIGDVVELAQKDYAKLTPATAQRTLRFMNVHEAVK